MDNDTEYNIGAIIVSVLLVLVVLSVIIVQKYRDYKVNHSDDNKNVEIIVRDYRLVDLEDNDYIVEYVDNNYKYVYQDSKINLIAAIEDKMYFSDSKGLFSIDINENFIRNDLIKYKDYSINDGYIYDGKIYYVYNNKLYFNSLNDINKQNELLTDVNKMVLVNGIIYYTNINNDLYSYDIVNKKSDILSSFVTDFIYKDGFIIMISDNELVKYDLYNNKGVSISNVEYSILDNNVVYYNGIIYYLSNGAIYSYVNSNTLYYNDNFVIGLVSYDNGFFKGILEEDKYVYLNKGVVVDSNNDPSYELVINDNKISFNASNIKK
ncbi:MAG: hypothetical protein ACI4WW_03085 [Candidatus Coprovivens sp.]